MSDRKNVIPTANELMKRHVEALFTHDRNGRLLTINEPWPGEAPAPRFFLGRTVDGTTLCRFRYDVPEMVVERVEALCSDEPVMKDYQMKPMHFAEYMDLLQEERYTAGPCFLVPIDAKPKLQVVSITRVNLGQYLHGGFEWLTAEIDYAQPCVALVRDGRVISICRSVRITPMAHEAGLETLDSYRGKGYASQVVAGWAMAVRKLGCLPLYSTLWDNHASQSVARKLGLALYGANFTVY